MIDSTADLLFRIGANSDDAEDNITRFRALLGKDLGEMGAEFSDWSKEVFGDLRTVQGATIAAGAALAAAVVAVGAAAIEAAGKYAEYVTEVDRGAKVTGISVEKMSGLKFMAAETGTSYDALVTGLTRFASTITKASEGGKAQAEMFHKLGISQDQVKAGEKDMMPLLELVSDRFKGMGSTVEKTAMARELFSRGGAELVRMLSLGSEAIKDFNKEAAAMGLVITTQDVVAVKEYKAAVEALKAEHEALDMEWGKKTLPLMEKLQLGLLALWQSMGHIGQGDFIAQWAINFGLAEAKVKALAESLAKLDTGDKDLGPKTEGVAKAKEEWSGLADVLTRVKEASEDNSSVDDRTAKELEKLQDEIGKAVKKYDELRAAGKLTAEDAAAQAAALKALTPALSALMTHDIKAINEKNAAEQQDMFVRIIGQQQQTTAQRMALWDAEITKLRETLEKKKALTADNLELLAALEKAGYERIGREQADAVQKAGEALDAKIEQQSERTLEQKRASWNREIDQTEAQYAKEEKLSAANIYRLVYLRKAGLDKIAADAKAAGDVEIARLDEQLARIQRAHETTAQRIVAEYQAEAAKYVAAEEKKTLATAVGEAQRAQIMAQFAAIRKGLLDKEQQDLQAYLNSQGFQGVFGSKFADWVKGNEALLKQWQTSTHQSVMMVQATLEGLKEAGEKTFEGLAQGMGSNIAAAVVHSKSVSQAMRATLEATLESLAGQALVNAIYATAYGFQCLAWGDAEGAAASFTSAALWGSLGAAAAVAGKFAAGGQGGAGGGAGSGAAGAYGAGNQSTQNQAKDKDAQIGAVGPTTQAGGPHVTVNVYGHVVGTSGVGELCGMLNDAVLNGDYPLTATNTKTGVQVTK